MRSGSKTCADSNRGRNGHRPAVPRGSSPLIAHWNASPRVRPPRGLPGSFAVAPGSRSIPCRALTVRASSSSFGGVLLGRIRSRGEQLREVPSPDLLRSVPCASWRTPSGRRGTRCRGHARFAEPRLPSTYVPDGRALLHCGYACPASECARTIDSRWSPGRRVRSRRSSMPECVAIARLGAAGEIPSLCY